MSAPGPLLVLAGMRSLGESAEAYGWCLDRIHSLLLPHAAGTRDATLVTCGVAGPEVWAEMHARRFGLRTVVYHVDGTRTDSKTGAGRWAPAQVKTSTHSRDQQLVDDLARAARAGRRIVVVGLLDTLTAARSGTQSRLDLADDAGLSVQRFFWGQAPAQEAAPAAAEQKGEAA